VETYVKLCPECKTATALQAMRCHVCGHVYRTKFDPATGQVISRSDARSIPLRQLAWSRALCDRIRTLASLLRLLFLYSGPVLIAAAMGLLMESSVAPVLLICLLIWLWYLSDAP
jgi:hypothetical protein